MDSVRRALGTRRVGHTGTLDPFATGLLVVLVSRATRLSQFLVGMPKEYVGVIRLGVVTDSHDSTGQVVSESHAWEDVSDARLCREMEKLTGRLLQRPPAYSAKKVGGQRAYRLARRGAAVALEPQDVEVFAFEVGSRSGPEVMFSCRVSSGTYVRALARDLGDALGVGAHVAALRRTSLGPFRVEDAVPIEEVHRWDVLLGNPLDAVRHLPRLQIGDGAERERVVHGRPMPAPAGMEGPVALIAGDTLVAVAARRGEMLWPKVVLEG